MKKRIKKSLVFGIVVLLVIGVACASVFVDDDSGDFGQGVYSNTEWDIDHIELSSGMVFGNYTSGVFDAGTSASWDEISWTSNDVGALENDSDMVLLLHMDETSGIIVDYSGRGNNGTNNGASYGADGKFNTGLDFESSENDYVSLGNSALAPDLNGGSGITLSAWIKPESLEDNSATDRNNIADILIHKDGDMDKSAIYLALRYGGNIWCGGRSQAIDNFQSTETTDTVSTGSWQHIICMLDYADDRIYIYYDGVLQSNASVSFGSSSFVNGSSTVPDVIGTKPTADDHHFDGLMDEIAVWNRTLTSEEISDLYNEESSKLNFSVRSCDDDACSGESWTDIADSSPQTLNVLDNRYFQYKVEFTTENASHSPELYNVSITYSEPPVPKGDMVVLIGNATEIGTKWANENKEDILAKYNSFRSSCSKNDSELKDFAQVFLNISNAINSSHWVDEANAIADIIGVDRELYIAFVSGRYRGLAEDWHECTSFVVFPPATKDNQIIFHKTRDTAEDNQAAYVKHTTGENVYKFFAEMGTSDTGLSFFVNEKGLAGSCDQGGSAPAKYDGLMNHYTLRYFAETCETVDDASDALHYLVDNNYTAGVDIISNYLFIDKNGDTLHIADNGYIITVEETNLSLDYGGSNYPGIWWTRSKSTPEANLVANYGDIDVEYVDSVDVAKHFSVSASSGKSGATILVDPDYPAELTSIFVALPSYTYSVPLLLGANSTPWNMMNGSVYIKQVSEFSSINDNFENQQFDKWETAYDSAKTMIQASQDATGFMNEKFLDFTNDVLDFYDNSSAYISPDVSLIFPSDEQSFTSTNNVTFNVSATDNLGLDNCTLYTNISGAWQAESTKIYSGTSDSDTWSLNELDNAGYRWNAYCCDNDGNCMWALNDSTFEVDYDPQQGQASTTGDYNGSDFDFGTYNNTEYNNGVQISSGNNVGYFISRVFNAGSSAEWSSIEWASGSVGELPSGMSNNALLLHMNEASGTISDSSGSNNHGTNNGATYSAEGKFNTGLDFERSESDYVSLGTNAVAPDLNGADGITLSAWIKPESLMDGGSSDRNNIGDIVIDGAGPSAIYLTLRYGGNIWCGGRSQASDSWQADETTDTVSTGEWQHVACILDYANDKIYIYYNGEKVDEKDVSFGSSTFSPGNPSVSDAIGVSPGLNTHYFDGLMDEVSIWSKALSLQEVEDLYKRGITELDLSIRSCDDSACSGESWMDIADSSPQTLNVSDNKYFQYKFDFETENISYSPELYNVTIEYIGGESNCTPNLVNTSWTDWVNVSCLPDDTMNQSRSLTQYDANDCGAENQTFTEYRATEYCDFCTPNLQNTSWSEWSDIGCSGDNMNQSRSKTEYDSNSCGEIGNTTYYEYQLAGPDLVNTTWSDWSNISCLSDDTMNQTRDLTEYDSYSCASNTTYFEYRNTLFCDYCMPSLVNQTGEWQNISCLNDDTMNQSRQIIQYDENDCGEISNQTFTEYRATEYCDYCIPNMVNTTWTDWYNMSECHQNNTYDQARNKTEYDANSCGEIGNATYYEYQTGSCEYYINVTLQISRQVYEDYLDYCILNEFIVDQEVEDFMKSELGL